MENTDQVHALTQALLECARSGDWDSLVAIEAQRRPLLYACFAGEPGHAEGVSRERLREILQMDQETTALVQQRRDELSDWLNLVGQGRSAVKAYGNHSR